jgi:hypothetical protein
LFVFAHGSRAKVGDRCQGKVRDRREGSD